MTSRIFATLVLDRALRYAPTLAGIPSPATATSARRNTNLLACPTGHPPILMSLVRTLRSDQCFPDSGIVSLLMKFSTLRASAKKPQPHPVGNELETREPRSVTARPSTFDVNNRGGQTHALIIIQTDLAGFIS